MLSETDSLIWSDECAGAVNAESGIQNHMELIAGSRVNKVLRLLKDQSLVPELYAVGSHGSRTLRQVKL